MHTLAHHSHAYTYRHIHDHTHTRHTHTNAHTHTHTHTCTVFPHQLKLNSTESFGTNGVSTFLEWKEEPGVTYIANASPSASLTFTGNAIIQLILSYNTIYKVNIKATLCGQNSINTILNLSYGELISHNSQHVSYYIPLKMWCSIAPPGAPHLRR